MLGYSMAPVLLKRLVQQQPGLWTWCYSFLGDFAVTHPGFLCQVLGVTQSSRIHLAPAFSSEITVTQEPETLYKGVSVLVKGHDKAVLDSYETFATSSAKELGIKIDKVFEPPRKIERLTLLKSVHIFKKHRVQYEMRTHYRCIELKHLTGSTANVYLEYIQRNLPEGVAMEVKKTTLEKIPEHIKEPVWSTGTSPEEASLKQ
ncbi:28S ribosomal protein S10, mitochondrial [Protopterus annectens]|uniref:28S ribosomal protein S10, mitochondrial n=1 Tax=Protopterus annectens TaxID=7888 RepID=UPI001CFC31CD|nr:28S ribosomal protein S10, mitochondrial [Protopterus annectens]